MHAITLGARVGLRGPRDDAPCPAHRLLLVVEPTAGRLRDLPLHGDDLRDAGERPPLVLPLRVPREIRRPEEEARRRRSRARDAPEEVHQLALVLRVAEARLQRLVRAVGQDDEIRRGVAQLLGEVRLVPAQRGEDLRPVDAERVHHDPGLRAVERHPEDAHVAVAHGAKLDLVGRVRHVEREPPGARQLRPRRDPAGARPVDEDVEAPAPGVLAVVELDVGRAREDVRPRAPSALGRRDADAEQAVAPVDPAEGPVLVELDLGRLELLRHPPVDAVLHVALPRLADRHEAAAPVAEARLERAAKDGDAEIAGGVRVAVLEDVDVVVGVTVVELRQRLEEVRQAVRAREVADGGGRQRRLTGQRGARRRHTARRGRCLDRGGPLRPRVRVRDPRGVDRLRRGERHRRPGHGVPLPASDGQGEAGEETARPHDGSIVARRGERTQIGRRPGALR